MMKSVVQNFRAIRLEIIKLKHLIYNMHDAILFGNNFEKNILTMKCVLGVFELPSRLKVKFN